MEVGLMNSDFCVTRWAWPSLSVSAPPRPLPEGGVVEAHHGHGVLQPLLLLGHHVDDEEGDEGREGQHQVDGDEGVGELVHLHGARLAHHHHTQL